MAITEVCLWSTLYDIILSSLADNLLVVESTGEASSKHYEAEGTSLEKSLGGPPWSRWSNPVWAGNTSQTAEELIIDSRVAQTFGKKNSFVYGMGGIWKSYWKDLAQSQIYQTLLLAMNQTDHACFTYTRALPAKMHVKTYKTNTSEGSKAPLGCDDGIPRTTISLQNRSSRTPAAGCEGVSLGLRWLRSDPPQRFFALDLEGRASTVRSAEYFWVMINIAFHWLPDVGGRYPDGFHPEPIIYHVQGQELKLDVYLLMDRLPLRAGYYSPYPS